MFASLTATLTDAVGSHGVYAVFGLMALDAILPVGGELVMLYAGVLAAGALGYLFGSLVGWAIGRIGGRPLLERHGRWLHLGPERLEKAERWFERFGLLAVFLGRLTPLVRSFISIPAGVLRSPLPAYTLLTLAGSLIWCLAFAGAGWAVGSSWESVHGAMRYVDYAVVLIVLGLLATALVRWRRSAVRSAA
jgi:membrane protein DedA with SNARE-associated domain